MSAVLYTKVTSIEFTGNWTHEPWGDPAGGTASTAGADAGAIIHRDGEPDVILNNVAPGVTIYVSGSTAIIK